MENEPEEEPMQEEENGGEIEQQRILDELGNIVGFEFVKCR